MAAKAAGGGRWEVVKKSRRPRAGGGGRGGGGDRRALGEANGVWKYDLTPPIQTTSTLYERGFEKIMKRQNKEQVPPPAVEPKKPANKKQPKKVATLNNQNQKQGPFRSLEEAMKAAYQEVEISLLSCTAPCFLKIWMQQNCGVQHTSA